MASKFSKILTAYESAYYMKPYRNVKIYPSILTKKRSFSAEEKKELTKKGLRWYVYFDYLNPKTRKYERQAPVTKKINRNFPDFDDRLEAIKALRQDVAAILKDGLFNPYEALPEAKDFTIISALDFAIDQKKKENIGSRTISGYEKSVKALKEFIKNSGKANYSITKADKKLIVQFLASLKVSNRTKNNYRSDLSAVFGVLVDHEYISFNPIEKVKKQEAKAQIDFNYSEKDFEEIISYLEKEEPVMLMFIRLVSFQFWRPKENCRIKRKDVDLENRTVKAFVKQGKIKTKLIPNILYNDLKKYLKKAKPEDLIFTPTGPGSWERDLDGRRDYFTYRFRFLRNSKKWKNKNITIYDFRHFYTTRAYKNILAETKSHDKTISMLSKITGHTSSAILKYIHYRDISLPEDYSKYLK